MSLRFQNKSNIVKPNQSGGGLMCLNRSTRAVLCGDRGPPSCLDRHCPAETPRLCGSRSGPWKSEGRLGFGTLAIWRFASSKVARCPITGERTPVSGGDQEGPGQASPDLAYLFHSHTEEAPSESLEARIVQLHEPEASSRVHLHSFRLCSKSFPSCSA